MEITIKSIKQIYFLVKIFRSKCFYLFCVKYMKLVLKNVALHSRNVEKYPILRSKGVGTFFRLNFFPKCKLV